MIVESPSELVGTIGITSSEESLSEAYALLILNFTFFLKTSTSAIKGEVKFLSSAQWSIASISRQFREIYLLILDITAWKSSSWTTWKLGDMKFVSGSNARETEAEWWVDSPMKAHGLERGC